jgi:hypothetical protein
MSPIDSASPSLQTLEPIQDRMYEGYSESNLRWSKLKSIQYKIIIHKIYVQTWATSQHTARIETRVG